MLGVVVVGVVVVLVVVVVPEGRRSLSDSELLSALQFRAPWEKVTLSHLCQSPAVPGRITVRLTFMPGVLGKKVTSIIEVEEGTCNRFNATC